MDAENKRVNKIKSPTLRKVPCRPPSQDTLYIKNTGVASKIMMTKAMIKVVNFSILDGE